MPLTSLKKDLQKKSNKKRAEISKRFFKTGKGEYGEGDIFIGITVPEIREIAKKYRELSHKDIQKLLSSPIHEERLLALLILVNQYTKGDEKTKKEIYSFYLKNTRYINNWDLVDLSADKIVGTYLYKNQNEKVILTRLAVSKNIWERRIAMLSCFYFIKHENFTDALIIAKILLSDSHDLIHKVVGWMLREIGKRSLKIEEGFLQKHYKNMPRTMLRYAIEKFPEPKRKKYLHGKI